MNRSSPVFVSAAVEGKTDEPVVRKLVDQAGARIHRIYVKRGKNRLKSDVRGYDNAARRAPWFVLVDLDRDKSLEPAEDCAPILRREWLPNPASGMCLRVAVRAMEAWLLADAETLAEFLHVPRSRIPGDPEALDNPKRQIVNLASRSNHPAIRRDMIPREGSGRSVGPGYESKVIEYAQVKWRPGVAAKRSDSLRRAMACLDRLVGAGL